MSEIKERTVYLMWRNDKVFDGTDVYVGSTLKPLSVRLSEHRSRARGAGYENNPLYGRMREVGVDNWEITALFSRTCDKDTIRLAEREKFRELNADLNTRTPITTPEERRQHKTDYRKMNKDKISKQMAGYRKMNKDKKRHYCAICEVACESDRDLQRHFYTIRHGYAYLNSLD